MIIGKVFRLMDIVYMKITKGFFPIYLFFLVGFFGFFLGGLGAQNKKPDLALEDELLDIEPIEKPAEKPEKGKIDDEKIVVEGDDEQLLKHKKDAETVINPDKTKTPMWGSLNDRIGERTRSAKGIAQRRAQVAMEYGSYHSLNADIYVSRKDEVGTYLLEYSRRKYDSEGFGIHLIGNSELSHDTIDFTSGFTISPLYRTSLKIEYEDRLRGLQKNVQYRKQFKRGAFVEWQNQFRPGENQRLNLTVSADYLSSDLESGVVSSRSSAFHRLKAAADWSIIFGNRNSLSLGSSLSYGENQLYENLGNGTQFYRNGDAYARSVFPLYVGYLGAEKIPWKIDLTLGAKIFFGQQNDPVFGPLVAIDSFYGDWHSRLLFEGGGQIPEIRQQFLRLPYQMPVHYFQPQELYEAAWKNRIGLQNSLALKGDIGYLHYNRFYNFSPDAAHELYTRSAILFSAVYLFSAVEYTILPWLIFEAGMRAEYQAHAVNLREPISGLSRFSFIPGNWNIVLEGVFTGQRDSGLEKLKPFFLLNTKVMYKANDTVSFFLRGENLTNEKYILYYQYATSGFRGYFGINVLI